MEIEMQASVLYLKTVQAAEKYKIICHEGGSRSSKTYSIFQFFINRALAGDEFTLTIARDRFTWVKDTLLKDFAEITREHNIAVNPPINRNRDAQIYTIGKAEFTFWGLDTPAKAHGKKQKYLWINEVMDVNKDVFDQLEMRTTGDGTFAIILDYNPVDDQHWVFDLQKRDDIVVIKSTMFDNPFNPKAVLDKILSYEPTEENIRRGTADLYMWEVYGLGNKARLQGAVFEKWDIVDQIPDYARLLGYGQDFGYTNDPSALVALYMADNEIYLDELIYETGLLNTDIVRKYRELNINPADIIYGDSSEPKSIEEIRRYQFNIKSVEKGQDSIVFGIDVMKAYKMHITKRSINLERELRRYKWAEDKNGRSLNKPIDEFNHAIDAARYICMMMLKKKHEIVIYPTGTLA